VPDSLGQAWLRTQSSEGSCGVPVVFMRNIQCGRSAAGRVRFWRDYEALVEDSGLLSVERRWVQEEAVVMAEDEEGSTKIHSRLQPRASEVCATHPGTVCIDSVLPSARCSPRTRARDAAHHARTHAPQGVQSRSLLSNPGCPR
jgi:hypothetical protein